MTTIYEKKIPIKCARCGMDSFVRQKTNQLRFCGRSCKNKYFAKFNPCSSKIGEGGEKMSGHIREGRRQRFTGKNNPNWVEDKSKLQRYGDANRDRRSSSYREWRNKVWLRDNFKCKIANPGCKGRIEAHHILGYKDYPELRYEVNNGITLCRFHHPRKREEESKLSPYFQNLVAEIK